MLDAINRIFRIDKHNHPIDRIAKLNALVSGVALYPQLIKVICTGNVVGFSFLTYALIILNSVVWIVYAVHRKLLPLLISSILNCMAALGIVLFIIVA
ncbi:MAG: PQ-loop repeat-containing protein [Patescibacteria group bacterium]